MKNNHLEKNLEGLREETKERMRKEMEPYERLRRSETALIIVGSLFLFTLFIWRFVEAWPK